MSKRERRKERKNKNVVLRIHRGGPRDTALIMSCARREHVIVRKMPFARGERAGVTSARYIFFQMRSEIAGIYDG